MSRRLARRRGSLLLGVLLIVMIAAMVGLSMLSAASTHQGEAKGTLRRSQSRALAWSGVLAAVSQMESQRSEILAGSEPILKTAWSLGEGSVIRLIPPTASMALIVSESAKLDANLGSAEMLAKLDGLASGLEARVVQTRTERAFESAEELARVDGITPRALYGEADRSTPMANDSTSAQTSILETPLLGQLTVFSTDGTFRVTTDANDTQPARIPCAKPWGPDEAARATAILGEELAKAIEAALKSANGWTTETQIVQALRRLSIDSKEWGKVLDALTPWNGEVSAGKIDINRASPEVLATIPGIGPEHAPAIADARESLSPNLRSSVAWPLEQGILSQDEFERAIPWLTTRSTMWRIRVEAGFRRGAESDETAPEDTEIGDRSALEAVIDLTGERVRVAYLRDVTYLEAELALEESGRVIADADETDARPEATPAAPPNPTASRPPGPVSGRLSMDRMESSRRPTRSVQPGKSDGGRSSTGAEAAKAARLGRWTRGTSADPPSTTSPAD
jgi:DNA uptake protein ComE-like DNA-binding protein